MKNCGEYLLQSDVGAMNKITARIIVNFLLRFAVFYKILKKKW